jgi:hypothetical protein
MYKITTTRLDSFRQGLVESNKVLSKIALVIDTDKERKAIENRMTENQTLINILTEDYSLDEIK